MQIFFRGVFIKFVKFMLHIHSTYVVKVVSIFTKPSSAEAYSLLVNGFVQGSQRTAPADSP